MIDLKVVADAGTQEFDLQVASNGDLAGVNDLSSAVLVSLLTDGRATAEQMATPHLRGGWIGDAIEESDFELGSLLWTLEPAKLTQGNLTTAASLARDALEWMIEEGIIDQVDVEGQIIGPQEGGLNVTISTSDGVIDSQFIELWRATTFAPSTLPARRVDPVEFSPQIVPGLATYYNANLSDHTLDQFCGVIVVEDNAGTVDLTQPDQAKRPRRIKSSGGWHYEFFGSQHLTSDNTQLLSIKEGTAFMIIKPRAGALNGGRMLTFGFTGFGDAVRGLAIRQGSGGEIRLFGDAGNLDAIVASDGASIGIVARWGPKSEGGSIETSDELAATSLAYDNDFTSPNRLVIGAGFDGVSVDETVSAAVEIKESATYSRRITDREVLAFLDYAAENPIVSGDGQPFDDCRLFDDDTGVNE